MEDLAPSYSFVLFLQMEMSSGNSVRSIVDNYIKDTELNSFNERLLNWLKWHSSMTFSEFCLKMRMKSTFQRLLFDLLYQSVQGKSIFEPINSLEREMREASQAELDYHLGRLPYKLMVPLLLLQFPALLLLILGPLIHYFLKEIT